MAKKAVKVVKTVKKSGKRTRRELWMHKLNAMHAFLLEVEKPCYGLDVDLSVEKDGLVELGRKINGMPEGWVPRKVPARVYTSEQMQKLKERAARLNALIESAAVK